MTDTRGPCWVLLYPNGEDVDFGLDGTPHFPDNADALDAASGYGIRGKGGTRPVPHQLNHPCVPAVTCTRCKDTVEDDDFDGIPHYASQADAENDARVAGWTGAATEAWCTECAPAAPIDREQPRGAGPGQLDLGDTTAAAHNAQGRQA